FARACDHYDVRWVVSARDETKRRLEGFVPTVRLLAENGPIGIFRVERRSSAVFREDARASSDGRTIRFETSTPTPAILKYHWIPGLASDPPAELSPALADPASPAPFIEIHPPRAGEYVISWRPHG